MKLTSDILQVFQQRLKVGNRRGVHLNAVPGRSKFKFDLNQLGLVNKLLPEKFLQTLLGNSKFSFTINFDGVDLNLFEQRDQKKLNDISKRLDNLYNQVRDIELEKGINTFGFGYPLLIRRDKKDNKVTVAPLLIWSLKIKRPKKLNTWIIEKSEEDAIILNEVLLNHIETDENIRLRSIPEDYYDDGKIDEDNLAQICIDAIEQLNTNVPDELKIKFDENVGSCHTILSKDEFNIVNNNSFIHWGGLFSIFETQKQSIIKEYDSLLKLEGEEIETGELNNSGFQSISSIDTDPSQQGILNSLKTKRNLIIHGPPGTGKSQTLTAIIVNALENGKKVLVVCEKRTALDVLFENLRKKGLDSLAILLKDSKSGRREVVKKVRDAIDLGTFLNSLNTGNSLGYHITQYQNLIDKINECHLNINEPLLEGKNWTALIGDFLKKRDAQNSRPVKLNLDTNLFEFTTEEYRALVKMLDEGEYLYNQAKPFFDDTIPFRTINLNTDNQYQLEEKLRSDLHWYKQKSNQLIQLEKEFIINSTQLLEKKFQEDYDNIDKNIFAVKSLFENHYGNHEFLSLEKTNSFFYKFLSNLSNKKKQVLQDQQECLTSYQTIYNQVKQNEDLSFTSKLTSHLPEILSELEKLKTKLVEWKSNWNQEIETELKKTNYRKSLLELPSYHSKNNVFQELKNKFYNDNWFDRKFILESSVSTTIENLRDVIEKTNSFLEKDTSAFGKVFSYENFFLKRNDKEKKIINATKIQNGWSDVFANNYIHQLLIKKSNTDKIISERSYQQLKEQIKKIKSDQPEFILNHWYNKQRQSIDEFNKNNILKIQNLYNKRRSERHSKLSLRQIVEKDVQLYQSFFPVTLTNPTVASTLFGNFQENKPFDIVLFDEASQLRVEETLPSLLKGRQKIISGDEHQMPPSNYFSRIFDGSIDGYEEMNEEEEQNVQLGNDLLDSESLLDFGIRLSFENRYLDFHYRSHHPYLIDFSNAAFYNERLCPMPSKSDYVPIHFNQVDGQYIDRTNPSEASYVLNFLVRQEPNTNGEYPSIGIATFNLPQRNLIIGRIREKAINDKEFEQKLVLLEEKGLFVKNLENIQGDERDIIILSTTYGKDNYGKFAQRFGPINQRKGYKLLNVIITRAKQYLVVFTSIPSIAYSEYQQFLENDGNNRRGVFYAYLAYAKAVHNRDEEKRKQVLDALSKNNQVFDIDPTAGLGLTESPFEEEVYQLLLQHFDKEDIHLQYKFAGFRIDMVFKSNNANTKSIAIECDGAKYHSSKEAYLYDSHRQKILEQHGFLFHRIWSTNWWRDYRSELNSLVQFITDNTGVHSNRIINENSRPIESIKKSEGDDIPSIETEVVANWNKVTAIPKTSINKVIGINSLVKLRIKQDEKIRELTIKISDKNQENQSIDGIRIVNHTEILAQAILGKSKEYRCKIKDMVVEVLEVFNN